MAEENYPQQATVQTPQTVQAGVGPVTVEIFPPTAELPRLNEYDFYQRLFDGDHFAAFNVKFESKEFGKEYAKLRYIVANFPGLISKIIADMLFIEPPKINMSDDSHQQWVDAFIKENNLRIQNYESALSNSALGDSIYKLRIGKRHADDTASTIIVDEITPKIWFPKTNPYNIKQEPEQIDLCWTFEQGGKKYLRKEIHTPGQIQNKVFEMDQERVGPEIVDIKSFLNIDPIEETKIDRHLIVHVPNYRQGPRYYGISDYKDMTSLFYALNNRITKVDNILDTHSDPILVVPDGILDEDGKVRRESLRLFSRPKDQTQDADPKYVTWDANLEIALQEIDKLLDVAGMMSETAPALLGRDKEGQAESGRALKFKLLQTLAKAQRKQLYYTKGLADIIYIAQLLATKWDVVVGDQKFKGEPELPEIVWADGLPADLTEMIDNESKRIDAGLSTKADSIARLDDISDEAAQKKAKEIEAENKIDLPMMNIGADGKSFGSKPAVNGTPPVDGKPPVPPIPPTPKA